jgi:excinuclease ABC subunit B
LYADKITESMKKAMGETQRRRDKQIAHNLERGITPRTVNKQIKELIDGVMSNAAKDDLRAAEQLAASVSDAGSLSERDLGKRMKLIEKEMLESARNLEFEKAARLRDQLALLKEQAFGASGGDHIVPIQAGKR